MDSDGRSAREGCSDPPSRCVRCDAPAEDDLAVLTWTLEVGEPCTWMCPDCSRTNVRGIEARLDQAWW